MSEKAPPLVSDVRSPEFDASLIGRLRIYLDGVEQGRVVAYDVERRWLLRHVLDEHGNAQKHPDKDEVWDEEAYGEVSVTWAPASEAAKA